MGLNGTVNGSPHGNGNGQALGANLAFTKFLFIVARRDDDAARTRLRGVGAHIARGFSNDFDAEGGREIQPYETIQFLAMDELPPAPEGDGPPSIAAARYVMQVSSKYRPRLSEIEDDFRRRLGDSADMVVLDGAVRAPRYSSAEMHHYAHRGSPARRSGRVAQHAVIIPINKRAEWWDKPALDRHTYFYPHVDRESGCPVKGHALAAEPGIPQLHRRLYYNPDGCQRPGEWDFITYFECDDEGLSTLDAVCGSLRDTAQNPEWRFVEEGPTWRGRRVLKW